MNQLRKLVFLSLLVALALGLSIIETFIPVPFIAPGAKLGLANIVSLVTLVVFGFKDALIVGGLRSITFVLATGNLSSFFYSITGTILSVIIMFIIYRFFSEFFSLIGVSIFGAIFHNIGQITVASIIMENIKIFYYLPVMLLVSLFTGYFVGLAAIFISTKLRGNLLNNFI
ncbi:Gx transporter family protein [Caldisalinibacter kiritimatiensis]|uniref:Heptaprenyl diphosphate synthase component I n=1 Tax=Caldisalinibacter kiritimatiensis TaxID=1304284 RepID=R1AT65_9FIRM|nr:Gx transporter family protein [Caldisalinibacter kiritimatiensis]EOC99831.1 Heptaprenyl diphosphate synthase component I [Caldisalinibacter kiritimatiensis]